MVRVLALLLVLPLLAGCAAPDERTTRPADCVGIDDLDASGSAPLMPFYLREDQEILDQVLALFGDNVTNEVEADGNGDTYATALGGEAVIVRQVGGSLNGTFRSLVYERPGAPQEHSEDQAAESLKDVLQELGHWDAPGIRTWTSQGPGADLLGASYRAAAGQQVADQQLMSGHDGWAAAEAARLWADQGNVRGGDNGFEFPPKTTFWLGQLFDVSDTDIGGADPAYAQAAARCGIDADDVGLGITATPVDGLHVVDGSLAHRYTVVYGQACENVEGARDGRGSLALDARTGAVLSQRYEKGCP